MHYGDMVDGSRMSVLLSEIRPDEVYHLASQSHVRVSFDEPEYTANATGLGTIRLLEAIRQARLDCRFYQASTSEMFGSSAPPQNEGSVFQPQSPYGTAKVFAHCATGELSRGVRHVRVSGILFNHESPRRGETFVTRKITRAVARIQVGSQTSAVARQRRCGARLGVRHGVRRGDVADAAGRRTDDYVLATGVG